VQSCARKGQRERERERVKERDRSINGPDSARASIVGVIIVDCPYALNSGRALYAIEGWNQRVKGAQDDGKGVLYLLFLRFLLTFLSRSDCDFSVYDDQ
jgi:hypothetical protein